MDRIDAMTVFVAVVDEGSLAAAARRLGRSRAAVTRAVAFLEQRTATRLLHRTTRVVRLSDAGERYVATCRRLLAELEEAELVAAAERLLPRGMLSVTAPVAFGRIHVRPVVDAFLKANPAAQVRFLLLDRVVNLVEEGVDIAVRIGRLPDSSLLSVRIGQVRRVTCASPEYLTHGPPLRKPSDLATHDCIAVSQITPNDVWSFGPGRDGKARRHVRVRPRLIVNGVDAAIASAVAGGGVTCVLSYQVARELRSRSLVRVLRAFEPPPLPVQVVYPEAHLTARVRAFVDRLVPALRAELGA